MYQYDLSKMPSERSEAKAKAHEAATMAPELGAALTGIAGEDRVKAIHDMSPEGRALALSAMSSDEKEAAMEAMTPVDRAETEQEMKKIAAAPATGCLSARGGGGFVRFSQDASPIEAVLIGRD